MKRFFLPLLLLFAMKCMAVPEQSVFDFMDPLTLNFTPALTASEISVLPGSGDVVNITDKVLTSNYASISFSKGAGGKEGVALYHYTIASDASVSLYSLALRSQAEMTITATGNRKLSQISIDGALGNMTMVTGEAGSFNTVTKVWACGDNKDVTSVKFKNGANADTRIYKITVVYERPSTPLTLSSSIPANNGVVSSAFSSISLHFNTPLASVSSKGIALSGAGLKGSRSMTAKAQGTTVVLSVDTLFKTCGPYKVTVPAGVFTNTEGEKNEAITIDFTVRIPIAPVSVDPVEDTYSSLPANIVLSFSEPVTVDETMPGIMRLDGGVKSPVVLNSDSENPKNVVLSSLLGEIKEEGTWTIDIPAQAIHSLFFKVSDDYDTWNEAFTLTYVVEKQASAEMKEAKALLGLSGVGYPAKDSKARKQLSAAVAKGDEAVADELTDAIKAFYLETDVTMPTDSAWYRIACVNSDYPNEGSRVYVSYENEKAGLTTTSSQAGSFQALVDKDGKVVFRSSDAKKYLHVLTNNNDYNGTSTDNVTSSEKTLNHLTLAKLYIAGADSTMTLGKMTMTGSLGFTDEGKQNSSTAAVDFLTTTVVDSPTAELYFDDQKSSAFIFERTAQPIDYSDAVSPSASFTPRYGILDTAGDELILTVHNVKSASLIDAKKPYFTHNHGVKLDYEGNILVATDIPYEYRVNTSGLAADEYILVLPEGTFKFEANEEGKLVRDIELTVDFSIKKSDTPAPPAEDEPTATLSASQLSKAGAALTVTIGNVKSATLKNADGAYYILNGKKHNYTNKILSTTSTANQFAVNTAGLTDGSYTLVLPVGTFKYVATKTGVSVKDKEFQLTFTIKSNAPTPDDGETPNPNPDDKTDFSYSYGMIYWLQQEDRQNRYACDKELNDFILYGQIGDPYDGLYCNPNAIVSINDYYSNTTVRTGHFVQLSDSVAVIGYNIVNGKQEPIQVTYQRIKLVLDEPFKGGELDSRPGLYVYVIEPGTYGDTNFGKWVKNPKSINRNQCLANPLMIFQLSVDNDKHYTMSINEMEKQRKSDVIYDLQGRRQEGALKPGLYIINGQKRVVR